MNAYTLISILFKRALLILGMVFVVVIVIAYLISSLMYDDVHKAVYLDTGEYYFGVIKKPLGNYLILENVYYFEPSSPETEARNRSLIPRTGEVHSPQNRMSINKDHIIFIESLSSDSRVLEAINAYENDR